MRGNSRGRAAQITLALCALVLLLSACSLGSASSQPTPTRPVFPTPTGRVPIGPGGPTGGPQYAVFPDNGPASITLRTQRPSGSLAYSITDYSGAVVGTGTATASGGQATLTFTVPTDGYFVLSVSDATSTPPAPLTIPFAVVAPFAAPAGSPFGVMTHFADAALYYDPSLATVIATLGVRYVRNDMFWAGIEQTPGQYAFPLDDERFMASVGQSQLSPVLILAYNNSLYDQGLTPYDNAGIAAFANYAKAVVVHYGAQVKQVEVYNEYDGKFSTGPCAKSATCYVALLRATYAAVKSVRPDVTVIGGALVGVDLTWLGQVFNAGGLQYMDAISLHPYQQAPETGPLDGQMRAVESLVEQYNAGRPKPIWVSELGWSTCCNIVDEPTQARYLVRGAVLALSGGAQQFTWYDLLDDGNPYNPDHATNPDDHFGLMMPPGNAGYFTPKPAFVSYAVLARQLASATFLRTESDPHTGGRCYDEVFARNGTSIRVLWSTGSAVNVIVAASTPITVITMMGQTRQYTPDSSGKIALTVSPDPIYLLGAISGVAAA